MIKSNFIYILTVFLLVACQSQNKDQNEKQQNDKHQEHQDDEIKITKTQFRTAKFKLGKIDTLIFADKINVRGSIDVPPKNKASVSTFFEGYISKTNLLIGDQVKKGELLVELSNPDYITIQQNYVENTAELEYLTSEFKRKENLYKDQVVSEKVFQETKSLYKAAKARQEALNKKIKMMNLNPENVLNGNFSEKIRIYSPISGKISKMFISQGSFIEKSQPIMEIIDTDHVHLELKVFEKDINDLKINQKIEFQIPEVSDKTYQGYVRLIGAEIENDRSIKVHAHPEKESENFKVGMFVKAYFNKETREMPALPEASFADLEGHTYVLKLKQQSNDHYVFEKVEVEKTEQQNSYKPLVTSNNFAAETLFLTQGTFDLLVGDSAGHSH